MASSLNGTGVTFSDGSSQSIAWPGAKAQLFTASGTFTVPAGVTSVKVTVIGGGAGFSQSYGNGNAGGCGIGVYTVTPGSAITVTVGAGTNAASGASSTGGTTSFGGFVSATGGAGKAPGTTNGGIGSGGTIQNVRGTASQSAKSVYGMGTFFGQSGRVVASTTTPAIAWSIGAETVLSSTSGAIALLPGSQGASSDACTYCGGVGGVCLVEW